MVMEVISFKVKFKGLVIADFLHASKALVQFGFVVLEILKHALGCTLFSARR